MPWYEGKRLASVRYTMRTVWPIFIVHLLFVMTAGALWQHYFGTLSRGIRPQNFGVFIAGLSHWDSTWFLSIAKHGYVSSNPDEAAFFPLYPVTMRVAGRILSAIVHAGTPGIVSNKAYFLAGIIISNLSFLLTLACIYLIARRNFTQRQTLRGLWLLTLFPSSYYLSAAYSESIFLLFVTAAFLLAYHQKWVWAGACIGLAVLCRNLGAFGVPSLLWLVWRDFQTHRGVKRAFRNAAAVSLIPAGCLGIYLAWLNHVYHNPLIFMWAEKHHWNRHFAWIWTSLHLDYHQDPLGFLAAVLFIVILVASIRTLPFEQWLFSAFALLIPLSSIAGTQHPYPMSMIRFVLVLFPMFIFAGASLRRLETYLAVIATSTVLLAWLTGLFASAHWIA